MPNYSSINRLVVMNFSSLVTANLESEFASENAGDGVCVDSCTTTMK